jgi:hypothetical protein
MLLTGVIKIIAVALRKLKNGISFSSGQNNYYLNLMHLRTQLMD